MLTLSNWREPTSFWVVDALAKGIILGWSWMTQQEAVLDTRQECMRLGKLERHTVYWTTAIPRHLPTNMDWVEGIALDLDGADAARYCATLCKHPSVFQETPLITTTRSIVHDIVLSTDAPSERNLIHALKRSEEL